MVGVFVSIFGFGWEGWKRGARFLELEMWWGAVKMVDGGLESGGGR